MESKFKILIATPLYPPEIGGPATYTRFLEENLPKGEYQIRVVHFGAVKHLPFGVRHFAYFWKVLVGAGDVDLVYALDPLGAGIPAGIAAKLRGKRFFMRVAGDRAWENASQKYGVTESLDTFSASEKYQWQIRLTKRAQKFGASLAEKIIVPSQYMKRVLENWGVPKEKIKVIYNAFEAPEIVEDKEELRKHFGLSGTVLLSAGRLVPWKGFEMLVRLFPEIQKEFPDASLYIAGEGPEREKISRIIRELSLGKNVILLGNVRQEDLLRRLSSADLFLLNTSYEGLSHQLLEAMAVGTPIATTNVGGNPELITGGENGFLAKYNDAEDFLRVIRSVLNDKDLRDRFVARAKEKVSYFSIKNAIDSFIREIQ